MTTVYDLLEKEKELWALCKTHLVNQRRSSRYFCPFCKEMLLEHNDFYSYNTSNAKRYGHYQFKIDSIKNHMNAHKSVECSCGKLFKRQEEKIAHMVKPVCKDRTVIKQVLDQGYVDSRHVQLLEDCLQALHFEISDDENTWNEVQEAYTEAKNNLPAQLGAIKIPTRNRLYQGWYTKPETAALLRGVFESQANMAARSTTDPYAAQKLLYEAHYILAASREEKDSFLCMLELRKG